MNDWQQRVEQWAAARNLIEGSSPDRQMEKLDEERDELDSAIDEYGMYFDSRCRDEVTDAIGDMAVVLCIIAKQCGLSFEECLEHAWEQIKDRKGEMRDGIFVKEADL